MTFYLILRLTQRAYLLMRVPPQRYNILPRLIYPMLAMKGRDEISLLFPPTTLKPNKSSSSEIRSENQFFIKSQIDCTYAMIFHIHPSHCTDIFLICGLHHLKNPMVGCHQNIQVDNSPNDHFYAFHQQGA